MSIQKTSLKLVGMDPSLRNWGIAIAELDLKTNKLRVDKLELIQPILSNNKQLRVNSRDLEAATQLFKGAINAIVGADAIFVEVPVGSQSSRAMASYGICIGVLGALQITDTPIYEVTPTEVKLAGPGIKTATKDQMISWAVTRHPEANWPTKVRYGKTMIAANKAEHQADAIAAIYAGMESNIFKQLLSMMAVKS